MPLPPRHFQRQRRSRTLSTTHLAALALILAASQTWAQNQQTTQTPVPPKRPVATVPVKVPPAPRYPLPAAGANNAARANPNQQQNLRNQYAQPNNAAAARAQANATQAQNLRNLLGAGNNANNAANNARTTPNNTNQMQNLRNLFGSGNAGNAGANTARRPGVSNTTQQQNARSLFGAGNSGNGTTGSAASARQGALSSRQVATENGRGSAVPRQNAANSTQLRNGPGQLGAGAGSADTSRSMKLANLTGPAVPSRTFVGHPGPAGSTEVRAGNGYIVRKAADGSVMDVHSPRNGMFIHHAPDGSQRIMVDKPDRSRVFAASRGVQYVQHPYSFRGREFDHRTLVVQGRLVQRFYRPYTYAGTTLDVYAPSRYYEPNMYRWATTSFAPTNITWDYATANAPWYGYYRGYFTPDSTYTTPVSWLTDFVLASSLAEAYAANSPRSQPPPADAPVITPQVKKMLAGEVDHQVRQESAEAQDNAQNREPKPGTGSVVHTLADGQSHVFVVASDLDLVDASGRRCMISEGDVIQVVSQPKTDTSTADAVVLASKAKGECERAAKVEVALNDLQEMQNHMRETIDQGMAHTNAGKKAATVTPAFAAAAPPPDANAAREIDQERQIAAAAEG